MIKKLLCILLVLSVFTSVCAFSEENIKEEVLNYILKTVTDPVPAMTGGEWSVIGAVRGGIEDKEYFDGYYSELCNLLKENNGVLHERKYTEYSRAVLAVAAIGKDPKNVSGYNLLSYLYDFDKVVFQGTNGAAYALLALDSKKYEAPEDLRERYIEFILSRQNEDGGFSLSGKNSDVDVTAMCLQALAKYPDNKKIEDAVLKGINYLSQSQNERGGFSNFEAENSESTFQVIMALCELGYDLNDEKFIKNGISIYDNMMSYYMGNGAFCHIKGGKENLMATEQALYTLCNIERVSSGKSSLYRMDDVVITKEEKENQDKEYIIPEIKGKKEFLDIYGHKSEEAILKLAERGILNGKTETLFSPDDKVTRAEFAAIIVRALGLFKTKEINFEDVTKNDWFYESISVAYNYSLIKGISETLFNPHSFITKQEAAVITARTAKILDIKEIKDEAAIRNILSQFEDYLDCEEWAMPSLATLYEKNILSQDDMCIEPKKDITRAEIADIIYNLIKNLW